MTTTLMPTTAQTLVAYKQHAEAPDFYKDCFCYDDPDLGIVAEPLVHQTTAVIDAAIADAGLMPASAVELTFSKDRSDLPVDNYPVVELVLREFDKTGHFYTTDVRDEQEAWLCPELLSYFDSPPLLFYCHVKPLYA